jgi:hypothetical protein
MKNELKITRNGEMEFSVVSGNHSYRVAKTSGRWACDCPARGMCKHLRTILSSFGMGIGDTITLGANTDSSDDAGLLSPEEFDAEAGRDVISELKYIRSGREKRNYGC